MISELLMRSPRKIMYMADARSNLLSAAPVVGYMLRNYSGVTPRSVFGPLPMRRPTEVNQHLSRSIDGRPKWATFDQTRPPSGPIRPSSLVFSPHWPADLWKSLRQRFEDHFLSDLGRSVCSEACEVVSINQHFLSPPPPCRGVMLDQFRLLQGRWQCG